MDLFNLSSTSRKRSNALDLFAPLSLGGFGGDTKTLAEVGADLAEDLSGLSAAFGTLFRASQIDDSLAITLKPDLEGGIAVENEHPNSSKINQLFGSNSPMTPRVMVALARASLVNAAETDPSFNADYQNDARNAIRQHIDLLRNQFESSRLSIHNGEVTPVFA
jgi:hypothetical protein